MKKALKIIGNVLIWIIVIFALLVTILVFSSANTDGVPQLMGLMPLTVESQSMSPTFEQGDLIICQQIDDATQLKVDDVITFWTLVDGQRIRNTHRIVRIENENGTLSFITRGDNNPIDDEVPAYQADLIGKWTGVRLAGAGNIMAFLRTRVGFFVCILLPMALFFLFELYKFIVTVVRVKRPAAQPKLDEEEIKRRAIEEYLAAQKEKEQEADGKDKPEEKSEEKSDKKSEDKSEEKSDKKSEDKSEEKTDKKSEDKSEEKSDKKSEEKSEEKSDKKSEDKSEEKSDKKSEDKSEEKSDKKSEDKSENKTTDNPKETAAPKNDNKSDSKNDSKSDNKDENKNNNKNETSSGAAADTKSETKEKQETEKAVSDKDNPKTATGSESKPSEEKKSDK